jgi:hypothetical protein
VRSQIYTYFISDRYVPFARKFGMRVVPYPPSKKDPNRKLTLKQYIRRLQKKDWKAMIELREYWLSFLEWNSSYIPL